MLRLAVLLPLLFAAPALADGQSAADPPPAEAIPTEPCTPEASKPVAITELTRSPSPEHGACVTVEGLWLFRTLYQDLDAIYRDAASRSLFYDGTDPKQDPGMIGLYPSDRIWTRKQRYGGLAKAVLTGRMGDCQDLYGPDVLISGFCHTRSGPFIDLDTAAFQAVQLHRLTTEADRVRVGDLAVGDARWPGYDRAKQTMRRWVQAVADFDVKALLDMGDVEDGQGLENASEDMAALKADTRLRRSFAHLGPEPEVEAFLLKPVGASTYDTAVEDWDALSVACVCLASSCQGKWPIANLDAGKRPSHPYRCVQIVTKVEYRERKDGGWTIQDFNSNSNDVLAEPDD
jgi:hypothetical protein